MCTTGTCPTHAAPAEQKDDELDTLVRSASVLDLGALMEKALAKGLIKPSTAYGPSFPVAA